MVEVWVAGAGLDCWRGRMLLSIGRVGAGAGSGAGAGAGAVARGWFRVVGAIAREG